MRIDLHVHTAPKSPCSMLQPSDLIRGVAEAGLDGLCLTEHQVLWDPAEVQELAQAANIRLFRGNEITTSQGDILVFGFYEDVKGILTIQELREAVLHAGGFMIAAHPFRGFKTVGVGQLQLTSERAVKRKVFQFVDAIEVGNGRVSLQENELALQTAERLGLPGTIGSDAHRLDELGKYVMDFERQFETDAELLEELKAGRYSYSDRHSA